jgi:hypothetical protein
MRRRERFVKVLEGKSGMSAASERGYSRYGNGTTTPSSGRERSGGVDAGEPAGENRQGM